MEQVDNNKLTQVKVYNKTTYALKMAGSNYVCKPKDKIDTIDLKIIRCLSRDCKASYRDISSIVGITPNAIKERINMMVCNGIIQSFIEKKLYIKKKFGEDQQQGQPPLYG
jgi:hypothetical protein